MNNDETEMSDVEAVFFFSSRRRHTRCSRDWSSDVCSSDLFTAAVDPGVDLLAHALFLGGVKPVVKRAPKQGMLEGRNGCADDSDSLLVSARYQPTIAG